MGMPFQFIFSVILIAVVLFVAFWAISNFMKTSEQVSINTFIVELRSEIRKARNSDTDRTVTLTFSNKFTQ